MRPPGELEPGDGNGAVEPPPEEPEPDGDEEPDGDDEDEPPELPLPESGEGIDAVEPPPDVGEGIDVLELPPLGEPALPGLPPLGELGEPALPESFPQPAAASAVLTTNAMSVGRSQLRVGVLIASYSISMSSTPWRRRSRARCLR
jgi:hypothetical protein